MQAEMKIICAFRQLVSDGSFEKVKISEICAEAGVSRKTYYTHFSDKYELLEGVFALDFIKPVEELKQFLAATNIEMAPMLLVETIYKSMKTHQKFYQKLFGSKDKEGNIARDVSMLRLTNLMAELNSTIMPLEKCTECEREYISYYFAAAQTALISKWVREKMTVKPADLAQIFLKCSLTSMIAIGDDTWQTMPQISYKD